MLYVYDSCQNQDGGEGWGGVECDRIILSPRPPRRPSETYFYRHFYYYYVVSLLLYHVGLCACVGRGKRERGESKTEWDVRTDERFLSLAGGLRACLVLGSAISNTTKKGKTKVLLGYL